MFEKPELLKKNDQAPKIEEKTIAGVDVLVPNINGTHYTLLTFYRNANCPLCYHQIKELLEHEEELTEKNVTLVGIFPNTRELIDKHITPISEDYHIIADPEHKIYDLYHVKDSFAGVYKAYITRIGDLNKAKKEGYQRDKKEKIDDNKKLMPAEFLVDNTTGKIIALHYGKDAGDYMKFKTITDEIKKNENGEPEEEPKKKITDIFKKKEKTAEPEPAEVTAAET